MSLQVLGKLYAVLSDKEQKAIYDEQGVVDEESDVLKQDRCWEDYWRLLFPKVPEHRVIFVFSLTWLTNESQWMLFVCLCPGMMWHLSLRGGGYSKYMVRLHLCIIVNWCKHNIFQFVCFIINSLMFILQHYNMLSFHPPHRSQSRTYLSLRRRTRALTRSDRMWSSFTYSTREIWTPSPPQLCAAPKKMSPGCAAWSKMPSIVAK